MLRKGCFRQGGEGWPPSGGDIIGDSGCQGGAANRDLGKKVWGGETAGAKGLSGNMLGVPKGPKRGLCGRSQGKWCGFS